MEQTIPSHAARPARLDRSLGFWALTVYGVGDILGAGIYALVGEIGGIAGGASWLAFGVALGAAALTGLSYAELGSRFPRSGGESYFCQRAFGLPGLSLLVGWIVLCSGIVSMAAVSRAFGGYLAALAPAAPAWLGEVAVVAFLVAVSLINFRGIRQSSLTNIVCTFVEVGGLLLVLVVGAAFLFFRADAPLTGPPAGGDRPAWTAVAQAAALAFFAFIGFEDMVNVAEEVQRPRRTLPAAMLTALAIAGTIYIAVVWVATSVLSQAELASSSAPLLDVVRRAAPAFPPWLFTLIALFAVANTGLLNGIMGSRLIYGMARQGLLPRGLDDVHPQRRTPHRAIGCVLLLSVALALSGTLVYLAGTTSVLLLVVFCTVNVALLFVQRTGPGPASAFRVPRGVPVAGAASSLALIPFLPRASIVTAAALIGAGVLLVGLWRWKNPQTRAVELPNESGETDRIS